jgi:hypothetical protein
MSLGIKPMTEQPWSAEFAFEDHKGAVTTTGKLCLPHIAIGRSQTEYFKGM